MKATLSMVSAEQGEIGQRINKKIYIWNNQEDK